MIKADLHMHSTASDGRFDPIDLVELAVESGLGCLALTDHDTTQGLEEAQQACKQRDIRFLAGCEISSTARGDEVHLLAYGFRPEDESLRAFLDLQQQRRHERAESFLFGLKKVGALSAGAQLPKLCPGKSIARPHIAKMLIDSGAASDFGDAFHRYLTPGSKHFVPKPLPEGRDVIDQIHRSGGIVVLAHPGHYASHQMVMHLIHAGLDGIEVIHPSHDENLRAYYRSVVQRHQLLETGGSDFHGHPKHGGLSLGEYWIEPSPQIIDLMWT